MNPIQSAYEIGQSTERDRWVMKLAELAQSKVKCYIATGDNSYLEVADALVCAAQEFGRK